MKPAAQTTPAWLARLQQARAWVAHALLRLGWPGWVGLAMLALALGAGLGLVMLDALAAERGAELADARRDAALARALPVPKTANGDAQVLLARFDTAERLPDLVEDVHRRAAEFSIEIEQAEYRAQADLGGRALRCEFVLPARGSYPNLRNWLTAVLRAHPGATVLEFSLRRSGEGAGRLDARVRLAAYLRSGA